MFYLTSCDAKTVRRTSWGSDTSDRYFVSTTFGSKGMAQKVVLMFLMTLTFGALVVTQSRHEVMESPCEVS